MLIGIDIGGSEIKAAQVDGKNLQNIVRTAVTGLEDESAFLDKVFEVLDQVVTKNISAIGVGVPGIVDSEKGIIFDIQNIPLLKKVAIKEAIHGRYQRPVFVNNDANCFALGENYFGYGHNYKNFVGVTLGTGLGVGIIVNNELYAGECCGAGEIGMLNYKDGILEHYAGSIFFKTHYQTTGKVLYEKAIKNDQKALKIFDEFGVHIAMAIRYILFMYAPEAIVLGGSISKAYPFYKHQIEKTLKAFEFQEQLRHFKIHISTNSEMGILGAAALCKM